MQVPNVQIELPLVPKASKLTEDIFYSSNMKALKE